MAPDPPSERDLDSVGFDPLIVAGWFVRDERIGYTYIDVPDDVVRTWSKALCIPIRRAYISDEALKECATARGVSANEVLSTLLPDPGSTMSGDFAEILVFIYHATQPDLSGAVSPRKWRLKVDRTKPAPYSDVVYFLLPSWPTASDADAVVCSEVKAKATAGGASPIRDAIKDSARDSTSRLSRTLNWLRERAYTTSVDQVTLQMLDRFLDAAEQPPYKRKFNAIAVISAGLVAKELADAPNDPASGCELTVISVPELRESYSRAYQAVLRSMEDI